MAELKSCPFCGETPTTFFEILSFVGGKDIVILGVKCRECGIKREITFNVNKDCCFGDVLNAMEKAIEKWNRRAE